MIQYTQNNCSWHSQQEAGAPWGTHADTGRTCRLDTERPGIEPTTLLRWGDSANSCAAIYTKKLYKLQSIPFWSFVQHSLCFILSLLTHLYQINITVLEDEISAAAVEVVDLILLFDVALHHLKMKHPLPTENTCSDSCLFITESLLKFSSSLMRCNWYLPLPTCLSTAKTRWTQTHWRTKSTEYSGGSQMSHVATAPSEGSVSWGGLGMWYSSSVPLLSGSVDFWLRVSQSRGAGRGHSSTAGTKTSFQER